MKLDGKNIIFSEDITLSGQSSTLGNNLGDVLVKQDKELNKLKSNVKWLYKYGGTGSGTGSGSGSNTGGNTAGGSWGAVASISSDNSTSVSNISIINGGELSLKQQGLFSIRIHINNPGGKEFSWTLTANNNKASNRMNIDTGYTQTVTVNLNTAGTISILVRDLEGTELNISATFTVQDFTPVESYQTETGSNYESGISEFLLLNISDGLYYNIKYNTSKNVDYLQYVIENSYTGTTHKVDGEDKITTKSGNIRIPIVAKDDVLNALSSIGDIIKGFIRIVYTDSTSELYNINTSFILIPLTLFLITSTKSGAVYNTKLTEPITYNSGIITLQFKPYYGIKGLTARQIDANIVVTKNANTPVTLEQSQITLTERITSSWSLSFGEGNYKIVVTLARDGSTKEFTYYIYVKEVTSDSYYYFNEGNISAGGYPVIENYYQRNTDKNINFFTNNILTLTSQSSVLTKAIPFLIDSSDPDRKAKNSENDLFISLGLQYYQVNDTDTPIIKFLDKSNSEFITIYQDHITYMDLRVDIYVPISSSPSYNTSDFHLLQVYRRYLSDLSTLTASNNTYRSELAVYIDGVLEGVCTAFIEGFDYPTTVEFLAANYWCNTFDIGFINRTIQMDDSEILMYYYNYAAKILSDTSNVLDIAILKNCLIKAETEDSKALGGSNKIYARPLQRDSDFFITITDNAIEKLIRYVKDIPVLIMSYTATGDSTLKSWLSYSYGQSFVSNAKEKNIGFLYYYNGNLMNTQLGYSYKIKPQGSTTSEYFGKNLTLKIDLASPTEGLVAVFSPNFDPSDPNSFLPEREYTLKADCSDSSHSNNNAMGLFVNKNTTSFATPYGLNSIYKTHIKNCLTGFPCIVIVKDTDKDGNTNNYFLGIYNFNLGRSSYFNLGYSDNKCFSSLSRGYVACTITDEENSLNEFVVVAEIQDNRESHDYSQYDTSVLFPTEQETNTELCMFGDFVPANKVTRGTNEINIGRDTLKLKIQLFVEKVANAGGYIFEKLGKQFSIFENNTNKGYNTINTVPSYRRLVIRNNDNYSYANESLKPQATSNSLMQLIGNGSTIKAAVDYESVVEYYTTIMAFGMVDSVQKNQNIKSFNSGDTFYLAFYDMDTSFGKDNKGNFLNPWVFSDYWTSGFDSNGNLANCTIYRDYSKPNEGYDYPSSYLFAVAKYLPIIEETYQTYNFPLKLWAKWRALDGPCRTAKHVIDTYYAGYLSKMPKSVFNLDYRYKYLNKGCSAGSNISTGALEAFKYDSKQIDMFSGRNINRTKDWLNKRFHILDFYFNIGGFSREITSTLNEPNIAETDEHTNAISNTDVQAVRAAFSSNRFASFTPKVTSLANSFASFVANGKETGRYYFAELTPYNLKINVNGSQQTSIYGSANWVEIDSMNFLTASGDSSLSVNSLYLKTINANTGTISSWEFNMPSLESVTLTSANFSGTVTLKKTESLNMPNLNSINISGSKISLNVDNVPIRTINASNLGNINTFANSLTISNCNSLTSVNMSNSYITTVQIAYTWGNKLDLSNTHFKSLTVSASKPGQSFKIDGDSSLLELSINGFKTIEIYNCGNLNKININDSADKCTSLTILNCNGTKFGDISSTLEVVKTLCEGTNGFSINSANSGKVDVSGLGSLTLLSLYNTRGFHTVIGNSNRIELPGSALAATHIMYLNGKFNCTGNAVFNARYFTLRNTSNDYADITITSTNCSSMFSTWVWSSSTNSVGFNTADIKLVLSIIPSNVENINNLFLDRPIKDYASLIANYMSTDSSKIPFKLVFPNVTSAISTFAGTGINYWNKEYLQPLFGSASGVNIRSFIDASTVYAPIDFLSNIASKITETAIGSAYYGNGDYRDANNSITFINPDLIDGINYLNAILSSVKMSDIFSTSFTKLHTLHGCNINAIVDFENGDWGTNVPNLLYIYFFMRKGATVTNFEEAFRNLNKIKTIYRSLNVNNTIVDLYTLFNWNSISKTLTSFMSAASDFDGYEYNTKTYITAEDYTNLMTLIMNSSTITICDLLFKNCEFRFSDATLPSLTNSKIYSFNGFYDNVHRPTATDAITFDPKFFFKFTATSGLLLRRMFTNTVWTNQIPLNYFNTREISTEPVYVEDGTTYEDIEEYQEWDEELQEMVTKQRTVTKNTRVSATKIEISYTKDRITYINNMFNGVTFGKSNFNPHDYLYTSDNDLKVLKNTIIDEDDQEYTTYYTTSASTSSKNLLLNTEYTDLHIDDEDDIIDYGRAYNYTVSNARYPIVPPDFFYSKTNSNSAAIKNYTKNDYVFANTNLAGFLPEHLFKNCMEILFDNCFYNIDVLPLKQGVDSSNNKIYLFIADNFTNIGNLTNAFNFKLRLPAYTLDSLNAYTVLSHTSVGNITSMNMAWPKYEGFFTDGSTTSRRHITDVDTNKYYIMCTKTINSIKDDPEDPDSTERTVVTLDPGIPSNKISSDLDYAYALDKDTTSVLNGEFIKNWIITSTIKASSWIMQLRGNSYGLFISKDMKFPTYNSFKSGIISIISTNNSTATASLSTELLVTNNTTNKNNYSLHSITFS